MDLSPQQAEALYRIEDWYSNAEDQVFKLFGFAGTGKTTLAKQAADSLTWNALFAAYTGKAAKVLTSKGAPATTIHSLIYRPAGEYEDEKGNLIPRFQLDEDSPLGEAQLLVVDEVSMVNERIGDDLLGFGVPLLVLGDPAQLPPVKGGGFFTDGAPNFMLTEIHRTDDDEILELASRVRQGGKYSRANRVSLEVAASCGQVIVGTNKSRWNLNKAIRRAKGLPAKMPAAGDKVICQANNYDLGVLNGETFQVLDYEERGAHFAFITLLDDQGKQRRLPCWPEGFSPNGEEELKERDYRERSTLAWLTYSWAITCHKAQGSQWDSVLVVDESRAFRSQSRQWLYTAVTRAVDSVAIVAPGGIN